MSLPFHRRYYWPLVWRSFRRPTYLVMFAIASACSAYLWISMASLQASESAAIAGQRIAQEAHRALQTDIERLRLSGALTQTDIEEHTTPIEMNERGFK